MIGSAVLRRVAAAWREKLLWFVVLNTVFGVGYFAAQRVHLGTAREIPITALDRAIPFLPSAAWLYESLFLLIPLVALAMQARDEVRRHGQEMLAITLAGVVAFVLFPTTVPRPASESSDWFYRLIITFDEPLNALPSLHGAFVAHTWLTAWRMVQRPWLRAVVAGWCMAILWATLATQQHRVLDLAAGVALGCAPAIWRRITAALRGRIDA